MADIGIDFWQFERLLGQIGKGFTDGQRLAAPEGLESDCKSVAIPLSLLMRMNKVMAAMEERLRADVDRGVALGESLCDVDRSLADSMADEVGGRLPR
jgi:hypothetical protein